MTRRLLTLIALTATTATLMAQGTAGRFQRERSAEVITPGQQRLDIDVPLLQGSQPFTVMSPGDRFIATGGLNDLRLFSTSGAEIPYLLVPPVPDVPQFVPGRVLPITATDTPNQKASGFEVDFDTLATIDAIDLNRVPAPFLKRFRLEASGDRTRWTQLVAEGTAFSLPAQQLAHTRIEFEPGEYRYVRVTWDDTNSGRVTAPDMVSARRVMRSSSGPILRAPIAITQRPSEPGRSRFRLTLPAARLPIVALELTVGGGHLSRTATVLEASLVGEQAQPQIIGNARLVRVVQDGINADALRIPIRQPREPQLDLVVDNGDNPALLLEGVIAVFAELPWIYFESAPGPIVARFGDPRLAAPSYDLEAVRDTIPTTPAKASWRPEPPRTLSPESEGLPMPEVGGALITDGFEYAREIPAGPAGLITIPLDAAVMAHSGISSRRLTDLRVVDRSSLQVPYLLEKRDEPLIVDTTMERRDLPDGVQAPGGRITSYLVRLPFEKLPDARLVLSTQARVFKRSVTVGSVSRATERIPARLISHGNVTWVHADEAMAAPTVTFPLPESVEGDLFVIVEEGDNQPLPIDKVTILLPSFAMRLFRRPDLPLRLIYGKDRVPAPRYDLQLLAPQLMGRLAEEVTAGPEQRFGESATASGVEMVPPVVFWSVLALAVLVLLALIVRLMRREEAV
jgi:hypothetical protein